MIPLRLEVQTVVGQGLIVLPCLVGGLQGAVELGVAGSDAVGVDVGAAAVGILVVQGGVREADGATVLSDGNVDGVGVAVLVLEDALRPLKVHPRPAVLLVVGIVGPLVLLNGEEVVDVGVVGSHDNGLAVHHEPGVGVVVGLVNTVVDGLHRGVGIGVGVEDHLRRVKALLVQLVEALHELLGVVEVGVGVGHVEEQEVDVGQGEELCVLAEYPLVAGVVVAVQRLGEPVHGTGRAVLAAVHVVGLVNAQLVNDLLEVEHAAVAVLTVPQEVEETNGALGAVVGADLGGLVQGTVQVVGACITAVQVVIVVGNGVGDGLAVDLVGDGHGGAVLGGGVLQSARRGILGVGLHLGVLGIGPLHFLGGLLLGSLLLLLVGQLGLVLVEVEALGVCLASEEGVVLNINGLARADVSLEGVNTEVSEGCVALGVHPGGNGDHDGLPLAACIPAPLMVVGNDVAVIRAGAEQLTLAVGGGAVADGYVGGIQHLTVGSREIRVRVVSAGL